MCVQAAGLIKDFATCFIQKSQQYKGFPHSLYNTSLTKPGPAYGYYADQPPENFITLSAFYLHLGFHWFVAVLMVFDSFFIIDFDLQFSLKFKKFMQTNIPVLSEKSCTSGSCHLIWYQEEGLCPPSKKAVSTNIKHSRCIHLMSNFSSIHFHTKRLYVYMFDIVDTPFSYGRGLIVS